MKTKATLIIGASILTMFACDTKNYTEQDRVRVTNDLESYVDSLETAVKIIPVSNNNWDKIDERYDSLDSRAEKVYRDLDADDEKLEILEQRYETAVDNAKTETKNFEKTAEMHMDNVEAWWDKSAADVEKSTTKTGDKIEEATQESLDWLEKNFDKLSDNTRKEYEEIATKLHKD